MGRGQEHPFHLPTPTTASSRVFLVNTASSLLPAGSSLVRLPSAICATLSFKERVLASTVRRRLSPASLLVTSPALGNGIHPRALGLCHQPWSLAFSANAPPQFLPAFSSGSKGRSTTIGSAPDRVVRLISRIEFIYRREGICNPPVPLSQVGTRSLPWGTTAHN